MRVLGWIGLVLGIIGLVLAALLIFGNPQLATPGAQVFPSAVYEGWRFVFGLFVWGAAVWLAVGLLGVTRQPRLAWLMLLAYVLLFGLYIVLGGILPSSTIAIVFLVVLGIVVPIVVWVIARAIGRAALRRRAAPAA